MHVTIRSYEEIDAHALQHAARESTREVFPWLPWCRPDHSLADARSWIRAQVEARRSGIAYEFLILSEAGEFLGGCGLNHLSPEHRSANLGYWIRTSATGRGVAAAAVATLARWAFRHTDLERLEMVVAVGNGRSRRVAEKAGACFEGVARSRLLLHGTFHDAMVYSIIRPRRLDGRSDL